MKNKYLSIPFTFLMVFSLVLLTTSSCQKEENNPQQVALDQLEGEWSVTSYKENGEEIIATVIDFKMTYDEYRTNEGNFRWNITWTDDGSTDLFAGIYKINAAGNTVELSFMTGELADSVENFSISFADNEVTFIGFIDEYEYIIIGKQ